MSPFLTTHRLYLTPLSPIHIGCGEDFEPTNYVIEDGWLYGFDPSRAVLNDVQRKELDSVARRNGQKALLDIQHFFHKNAATFMAHADVLMPVCRGVVQGYEKRIGQIANMQDDGKPVFNRLEIERHVHTGAQQLPFIPGSSFKGALRTAWLDELNDGKRPQPADNTQKTSTILERRLLWGEDQRDKLGDFETSPLRLLKVADFMPMSKREPEREVLFAVDRKKHRIIDPINGNEVRAQGPTARKECVLSGQYRLFAADVTLPALLQHAGATDSKNRPLTPNKQAKGGVDLKRLARQSNDYHLPRLRDELKMLDARDMVRRDWKRDIDALTSDQSELGRKLTNGDAFLIRLGRYGGAESKTLSGEGVAHIKIMGETVNGKKQHFFQSTTKTVWLAAQREDEQNDLIPFGWAIVEIAPQGDCASLQKWCAAQSQGRPNMADKRAQLQSQRQAAEVQKAEQAAQAAARAQAQEAERQAAEQRAQALAQMTPQAKQTEELRQKCENWAGKLPPHGNFKKQTPDANKAGLYQDAARLVNTALQDANWSAADKAALADMLEKWLPQAVALRDIKEQFKKLKLAQLRSAA